MKKSELKDKIKNIVKQIYQNQSTGKDKVDLDKPSSVSLDTTRFPALVKFPKLKEIILKVLTKQYDLFLKDIEWVAPRPTTFRIVLANDQVFYLIYTDRSWIGKVEGKKYYLLNINEEQNFIESIARILSYGAKQMPTEPKEEPKQQEPNQPAETPAPEEPAPESETEKEPTL